MKIFSWVGDQFANNFFNMVIYTAACVIAGWFTGPVIPGVNRAVYKLIPASIKHPDDTNEA